MLFTTLEHGLSSDITWFKLTLLVLHPISHTILPNLMLSVSMVVGLVTPLLDVLHLLHCPGITWQICYSRLQVKQWRRCKWSPQHTCLFSFQSEFSQSCRSSYHPVCRLPCSTMMRFVVAIFSSSSHTNSSGATILGIFHPSSWGRGTAIELNPWYTTTIKRWANLPPSRCSTRGMPQFQQNT